MTKINNHVVKFESGHPGYRNYIIMSNVCGMEEIKNGLEKIIEDKKGKFSLYKTEQFEFKPNGSIVFEIISDDDIKRYHKPKLLDTLLNRFGCFFLLPFGGFTVYGLICFAEFVKSKI